MIILQFNDFSEFHFFVSLNRNINKDFINYRINQFLKINLIKQK